MNDLIRVRLRLRRRPRQRERYNRRVRMNPTELATSPVHLLVCEDDEHVARGLCRNLEVEGFEVSSVGSGEAALSVLERRSPSPDVLILDIMLPGID